MSDVAALATPGIIAWLTEYGRIAVQIFLVMGGYLAAASLAPQGMAQGMAAGIKRDSHPTTQKVTTQLKDIKKTLPLRVLSEEDFRHWQTRGYVIVRNAVPADHVERLKDLLWRFEEKDRPIPLPGTLRSAASTS